MLADVCPANQAIRVAVAIAVGSRVFQVRFERSERCRVLITPPFDAGRLIELEFVLQIFAHARHDQLASIAGSDLCESPLARGPARHAAAVGLTRECGYNCR